MKYIYYPEYELEYKSLLTHQHRPNHILNLRLLMFLCNHVVIPPSHLLRTNTVNIIALINNLQEFFQAGRIVTIEYQGGIDNHFISRIEREDNALIKADMQTRFTEIKENLLVNDSVEHNRCDEKKQLGIFDLRLRELISESHAYKRESNLLLQHMESISNHTGSPIYSNQFEGVLKNFVDSGEITPTEEQYFTKLMSNAYYFSGTYTMNSLVSYNRYFEEIDLQNSLVATYGNASNLIVDPRFLLRLFSAIGVNAQDIMRLKLSDYQEIEKCDFWRAFRAVFDVLYTDAQQLEDLLRQKIALADIYAKKRDKINKTLELSFEYLLDTAVSAVPVVGNILSIILSALMKFLPPMERAEKRFTNYAGDRIMRLMDKSQDPLIEFSYRLNAVLQELQTGD